MLSANIGDKENRGIGAQSVEFRKHFCEVCLVAVGQGETGATGMETAGEGFTNATGSAGDHYVRRRKFHVK